jgi:hypothetical protein
MQSVIATAIGTRRQAHNADAPGKPEVFLCLALQFLLYKMDTCYQRV